MTAGAIKALRVFSRSAFSDAQPTAHRAAPAIIVPTHQHNLVNGYTFDNFVQGKKQSAGGGGRTAGGRESG